MRYIISTIAILLCSFVQAQNIGIGTDAPADKLTVQTPPNMYGITHTDGTIKVSTFVGGGSGGGWIGTQSNHAFHIFTNNGQAQASFNTDFSTDFKGTKSLIRLYDGTAGSATLKANGNNFELYARRIPQPAVTPPGNIIMQVDEPAVGQLDSYILSGNVGIGTRTPLEKLSIKTFNNTSGFSQEGEGGLKMDIAVGGISAAIGTVSNHIFRIKANNTSAINIMPNGNVGIGTGNPDPYKLAVSGNIRSKEVVVETGWADYVFHKSYKRRSLIDLETFILENNHLPNIPSAAEIEKDGLKVGEMQKKMMEKIEELTLYVIELKKEIDLLKTAK